MTSYTYLPLAGPGGVVTSQPDDLDQGDATNHDILLQQSSSATSEWVGAAVSGVLGLLCLPITVCSCYTVDVMEETVMFRWGRYVRTVREPGLHFDNVWGRDLRKVSTKRAAVDLPVTTIVDVNGNPLNISAVVVYSFVDTMKAVLCVDNADRYIRTQAETVLKQVVSRFPYESNDENIPCLKKEVDVIGQQMVDMLQKKANVAGARIHSFQLKEMTYAPAIAAGMLRRQQAAALVEARQTIVKGAVTIAVDALHALQEQDIHMTEEEKTRLVTNLLTVICSETSAQPTIPLGSQ